MKRLETQIVVRDNASGDAYFVKVTAGPGERRLLSEIGEALAKASDWKLTISVFSDYGREEEP